MKIYLQLLLTNPAAGCTDVRQTDQPTDKQTEAKHNLVGAGI